MVNLKVISLGGPKFATITRGKKFVRLTFSYSSKSFTGDSIQSVLVDAYEQRTNEINAENKKHTKDADSRLLANLIASSRDSFLRDLEIIEKELKR